MGRGERKGQLGHFPPNYVERCDNGASSSVNDEITELRDMMKNLMLNNSSSSSSNNSSSKSRSSGSSSDSDLLSKLNESERIRKEQQQQISVLTSKVDTLSTQVNKQSEALNKQQKSMRKLSKNSSIGGGIASQSIIAPTSSPEEVEKLREYLNIEARQRRDLESIIRKLEANYETLTRQVTRLQRAFDENKTEQQIGKTRLRPVGRDLTQ